MKLNLRTRRSLPNPPNRNPNVRVTMKPQSLLRILLFIDDVSRQDSVSRHAYVYHRENLSSFIHSFIHDPLSRQGFFNGIYITLVWLVRSQTQD